MKYFCLLSTNTLKITPYHLAAESEVMILSVLDFKDE